MKKRILALLCAVCLVACMLPIAAQAAPALEGIAYRGDRSQCKMDAAMAQAYADAIAQAMTGEEYQYGQCRVLLLDVAGDGYPLLCEVSAYEDLDYTAGSGTLYTYQNGVAAPYDYSQDGSSYMEFRASDLDVGTIAGKGAVKATRHGGGGVDPYNETVYYLVSQAQMTPVHAVISENTTNAAFSEDAGREWGSSGPLYSYLDGVAYDWDSWEEIEDSIQWTHSYSIHSSGSDAWLSLELEDTTPAGQAVEALENYAMLLKAETATPEELLAALPYYGDRDKCRMDARMANAYADVIAQAMTREEYQSAQCRVLLLDVAGDGYPFLCEVCWNKHLDNRAGYGTLYTYQNGVAAPYDYSRDGSSYIRFDASGLEVGTIDGKGAVKVYRTGDHGVDPYNETVYYLASRTQMTPVHKVIWENEPNAAFSRPTGGETDHSGPLYSYIDGEVHDRNSWDWFESNIKWISSYPIHSSGSTRFLELELADTTPAATAVALLRAYAAADTAPSYAFTDILGTGWESEPVAAAQAAVSGEVARCYSLTDGMCYVILKVGDGYQGVLVQAHLQKGRIVWQAVRVDTQSATQEALEGEVEAFLSAPNLELDFGKLQEGLEAQDLADYLRGLLEDVAGKGPNDLAKRDLAAFVESGLSSLSTAAVTGKRNLLDLGADTVSGLVDQAQSAQQSLLGVLEENAVSLNKTVVPVVRAAWENVDLDKPCQVRLDREVADALEGCDLQVLLGDGRTYLRVTADDLTDMARDLGGGVMVQLAQEDGAYAVRFLDAQGEVVEQLSYPVTISLPASGPLDTIMATYAGGSDNWGGQYDETAKAISFEARYSGRYEVLENAVEMDDIQDLSEESRQAISFMVSKGYLSAQDGHFRPGELLTRYEFTQALVGMFFALDREQSCTFPDVPGGSPYYPYVASAQAKSIVNGYSDGTFSGDDPINREQVFALAARTLMEQKGYSQPADPERYLAAFGDRADLSDWAAPQVAMSVREGIASRGPVLLPKTNITREQAAVVLYRLFQLLYEAPATALNLPAGEGSDGTGTLIAAGVATGAVALAGGIAAVVVLRGKKRKNQPEDQTPAG